MLGTKRKLAGLGGNLHKNIHLWNIDLKILISLIFSYIFFENSIMFVEIDKTQYWTSPI